jgi:hypothetical protein
MFYLSVQVYQGIGKEKWAKKLEKAVSGHSDSGVGVRTNA